MRSSGILGGRMKNDVRFVEKHGAPQMVVNTSPAGEVTMRNSAGEMVPVALRPGEMVRLMAPNPHQDGWSLVALFAAMLADREGAG